jgi:DNA invertase Pin-like site-specific DNA recombinase
MKLAAVVRVSQVGGRSGDTFHADEEQVEEIKRYAAAHRAEIIWMEPEMSVSGGAPIEERPPLLAAIEGVEAGDYDGIIVANLKRLSRSRSGYIIWDRVEAAGGMVVCAKENLDTSDSSGRRFRDYALADAVAEREEHAERHAKRREQTVKAGIWRPRKVPHGLRFAGPMVDGRYRGLARRLVPGDDAEDVRWAFRQKVAGTPITAIADKLGMTASGVRYLLRNRVYLGELRDGEYVNLTAYEPLVDVATFKAAQVRGPRPARSGDGPALLAGLIRCASCGHVMTRRKTPAAVYGCVTQHSGERCPAPASITAKLIDNYVEQIALRELERLSVTANPGPGVARAVEAFEHAKAELTAYMEIESVVNSRDAFIAGVRKREQDLEAERAALRAEQARQPVVPMTQTGADAWEMLDAGERNQLLRGLLAAVVVARAGGRGARVRLEDRVRVFAFGANVRFPQGRGGEAGGIVPIPLPDLDDPDVLSLPSGEDRT